MRKTYALLISLLVMLGILVFYLGVRTPIRIALIGNFEEERNSFDANSIIAARIAEANINRNMGILGRKTELIIRHSDFSSPEQDAKFLFQNKIDAVITTANSTELSKLRPYLNKYKISTISVMSTAVEDKSIEIKNDYVYKILPNDEKEIEALFHYLDSKNIDKKFSIVSDDKNKEFMASVEKVISAKGGQVNYQEAFTGNPMTYVLKDTKKLGESGVILVLAPPKDTAFILQSIRKSNVKTPICGLSWSGDYNLLQYGGSNVEGFIFVSPVDFNSNSGNYYKLSKELEEKYDKKNGLLPILIYDSYSIISKAYANKLKSHISLKEAMDKIAGVKVNKGTGGGNDFTIHRLSDDISGECVYVVNSGQFVKVEEIK